MNGNVQNFLWRKRAAQLLPGSTKQRLCSPKNHWHVSLQSVGVIVNAVGLPRIAQRRYPGLARTPEVLVLMEHLGMGLLDSPSCLRCVCAPVAHPSKQTTPWDPVWLQAAPSWEGHAAGSPVSLNEPELRMESPLRNAGEWEKPACLPSTLRYLKEEDNSLDINNIKYWIPHNNCATDGDECTAKCFYISCRYRTIVKLEHQHSSGSKKNSTT